MKKIIIPLLAITLFTACSTSNDEAPTEESILKSKLTKQDSIWDYNFEAKLYLISQDSTQNTIIPRPVPHKFTKEVGYIVKNNSSMSLYSKNKEKLISQLNISETTPQAAYLFSYPTANHLEYQNSTAFLIGEEKNLMHVRLLKDFKTYNNLVFEESYPIIKGSTSNWVYSTYNYEIVTLTKKTHN